MADGSADYELDYMPGDYSEMREGIAPPRLRAGEKAPGVVITLDDIVQQINHRLAGQTMRIKIVVEDSAGNDIFIQPFPHEVRWGESVDLHINLALEVS